MCEAIPINALNKRHKPLATAAPPNRKGKLNIIDVLPAKLMK